MQRSHWKEHVEKNWNAQTKASINCQMCEWVSEWAFSLLQLLAFESFQLTLGGAWMSWPCQPLHKCRFVNQDNPFGFWKVCYIAVITEIAKKRREVRSKGENQKYTHLNTEFQRLASRNKKAFLSEQCREVEENSITGKTRDLFKKIRDTKGTLHAKMGTIRDRNGMDLTEEEDIKTRWQEYTELYKKHITTMVWSLT